MKQLKNKKINHMKNLFVMALFALFLVSCGTCAEEEACTEEVTTEETATVVEDSVSIEGAAVIEVVTEEVE
jgi:hypothetical protein